MKKNTVVVYEEGDENVMKFKWKWDEKENNRSRTRAHALVWKCQVNCCWDSRINGVVEKGKAQVGKAEVILRYSQLDTRTRYLVMTVIVPKPE